MKIELIFVGKTVGKPYIEALDDYLGRLNHYIPATITIVPQPKTTKSLSEEVQKQQEGAALLKRVENGDVLVLLDERGSQLRSVELAQWLTHKQHTTRKVVIAVGGPYGFSPEVYARANEMLSLSKLTFNHQMVRLILAEQLYRACTINRGEPYHHE